MVTPLSLLNSSFGEDKKGPMSRSCPCSPTRTSFIVHFHQRCALCPGFSQHSAVCWWLYCVLLNIMQLIKISAEMGDTYKLGEVLRNGCRLARASDATFSKQYILIQDLLYIWNLNSKATSNKPFLSRGCVAQTHAHTPPRTRTHTLMTVWIGNKPWPTFFPPTINCNEGCDDHHLPSQRQVPHALISINIFPHSLLVFIQSCFWLFTDLLQGIP